MKSIFSHSLSDKMFSLRLLRVGSFFLRFKPDPNSSLTNAEDFHYEPVYELSSKKPAICEFDFSSCELIKTEENSDLSLKLPASNSF